MSLLVSDRVRATGENVQIVIYSIMLPILCGVKFAIFFKMAATVMTIITHT